ncbi:hypothetical protein, partial [Agrobacterium pusense]|uniref:hypothetical protein n=1 Tax=Agrobacterium pusense TaxID=648995 RepID=UPI0013006405
DFSRKPFTWLQPNNVTSPAQGIDITAELLSQVAPLPWTHIALTGDYLWNEIDRPLERFRPIRANRFNPNNFAFP